MNIIENTTSLETLLEKANNLSKKIELPELTNPGNSSDMLTGKQLIDSNGNIVEGTMPNNGEIALTMDGINTKIVNIPEGYTSGGTVSLIEDEYVAINNTTLTKYTDLSEAINATHPYETVILLKDISLPSGMIQVLTDYSTLDLNGHSLEIKYLLLVSTAAIIDSNYQKGFLICPNYQYFSSNNDILNFNNFYYPVKVQDNKYQFIKILKIDYTKENDIYYIYPYFEPAKYELLINYEDLKFYMGIDFSDGSASELYFDKNNYLNSYNALTGEFESPLSIDLSSKDYLNSYFSIKATENINNFIIKYPLN